MDMHTSFVFFGTPEFSVLTLEALKVSGFLPEIVVTSEDKPVGRHQIMTPSPVKLWAESHNISVLTPTKIDDTFISLLKLKSPNLFVVSAYGKILPQKLLNVPQFGTLNVHPSLLPLYRGASPLEGPILHGDQTTGITIMKIDEMVDHGPIVAQEIVELSGNETTAELGKTLFYRGGEMLSKIIPQYILGKIILTEQDHTKATFTKKIKKEDGLVTLDENPLKLWQKYRAYYGWPGIYFMDEKNKRVKITNALYEDGMFKIQKVIPEGKKEVRYEDFVRASTNLGSPSPK